MTTKTAKHPHAVAWGRKGGQARSAKMTPDERKASAANAGKKAPGWPKGKPRGPRTKWGAAIPFGSVPLEADPPVEMAWGTWYTLARREMTLLGLASVPQPAYKEQYLLGHTPESGARAIYRNYQTILAGSR